MLAIMAVILAVIASVICLYGSYARGDYNNESDTDILNKFGLTERYDEKVKSKGQTSVWPELPKSKNKSEP